MMLDLFLKQGYGCVQNKRRVIRKIVAIPLPHPPKLRVKKGCINNFFSNLSSPPFPHPFFTHENNTQNNTKSVMFGRCGVAS